MLSIYVHLSSGEILKCAHISGSCIGLNGYLIHFTQRQDRYVVERGLFSTVCNAHNLQFIAFRNLHVFKSDAKGRVSIEVLTRELAQFILGIALPLTDHLPIQADLVRRVSTSDVVIVDGQIVLAVLESSFFVALPMELVKTALYLEAVSAGLTSTGW